MAVSASALMLVDVDSALRGVAEDPLPLQIALVNLIAKVAVAEPDITSLTVRLYGGWMHAGGLTDRASRLAASLTGNAVFPLRNPESRRWIGGDVELALSLLARPGFALDQTHRKRRGLPRVRYAPSLDRAWCKERDNCPAITMYKYSRADRPCSHDDCAECTTSMFETYEQKMVDSMIVSDSLFAASSSRWGVVAYATTDTDMIPAALHCNSLQPELRLVVAYPAGSLVSPEWLGLSRDNLVSLVEV